MVSKLRRWQAQHVLVLIRRCRRARLVRRPPTAAVFDRFFLSIKSFFDTLGKALSHERICVGGFAYVLALLVARFLSVFYAKALAHAF